MKTIKFKKNAVSSLLFLALFSVQCRKQNISNFCTIERGMDSAITNKPGKIVYLSNYKRYAVDITGNIPNNIDSQVVAIPCEVRPEFQKVGLAVTVSGMLKKLNNSERIQPQLGGQDLFYIENSQLSLQP